MLILGKSQPNILFQNVFPQKKKKSRELFVFPQMKATGEWSGPKKEKERKESDVEYAERLFHVRHGMILYIIFN